MNMKCEKCKNALPGDSEFCPFCGEKIPGQGESLSSGRGPDEVVTRLRCTKCGNALPGDSEFCPYCGEELPAHAQHRGDDSPSGKAIIAEMAGPRPELDSPRTPDGKNASSRPEQSASASQTAAPTALRERAIPGAGDPAQKSEAAVDGGKKKPCRYCSGPVDLKTKKCTLCGKRLSRFPKRAVGIASLAIVFAALVGLNVYQYVNNASVISDLKGQIETKNETIAAQESEISTQNATILDQNSTISNQKVKIYELRNKGSYYDKICSALSSGNIGAASADFKVSEGVVVLRESQTKQVTLTALYGGSLSVDYFGSSASVSYGKSWYHNTLAVFISAWDEGVTVVTFRDDIYSLTFKMVIIVTN